LKESDLLLTLTTLAQQLDRPFAFHFDDGASVSVSINTTDISAYAAYLATPVADSSLPFDTQK
jgi:hypothetical protein